MLHELFKDALKKKYTVIKVLVSRNTNIKTQTYLLNF